MSIISVLGQVLTKRNKLKTVQQISWTIKLMEKKYPALDRLTEEELNELLTIYNKLIDEIKKID